MSNHTIDFKMLIGTIKCFLCDIMSYEDCEHSRKNIENAYPGYSSFSVVVAILIVAWSHKESILFFE